MKGFLDKFLIPLENNCFKLNEVSPNKKTESITFRIPKGYDSDQVFALNLDILKLAMFESFGSDKHKFINFRSADFAVVNILDDSVELFLLELGSHKCSELRDKFNASIRLCMYIVSLYLQKQDKWGFSYKYVFLHYETPTAIKKKMISGQLYQSDTQLNYWISKTNFITIEDAISKLVEFNCDNSDLFSKVFR